MLAGGVCASTCTPRRCWPPQWRLGQAIPVLILFEMESMSGEDVAKLTGMKLATIWVRLRRARAQFLREIERIERRDAQ